jgi:hypothetical protein
MGIKKNDGTTICLEERGYLEDRNNKRFMPSGLYDDTG